MKFTCGCVAFNLKHEAELRVCTGFSENLCFSDSDSIGLSVCLSLFVLTFSSTPLPLSVW